MMNKILLPECFKDYSVLLLNGKIPTRQETGWEKFSVEKRLIGQINQNGHNIGIITGPASGLLVLDEDNAEKFRKFCEKNNLSVPATRTVKTAKGYHYYYQYPADGAEYTNRSKKPLGFDIRGINGYVVSPGSIHPDTKEIYELTDSREPVPAPEWLKTVSETGSLPGKNTPEQTPFHPAGNNFHWDGDIASLPLKQENKDKIIFGESKPNRSEAVFTVLRGLIWSGLSDSAIFSVFDTYPIGQKYLEKGKIKDKWLAGEISRARQCTPGRAEKRMYQPSAGMSLDRRGSIQAKTAPESKTGEWPSPKKLQSDIPDAPKFPINDIPPAIRDYAVDVAFRMQCPVDFVIIPMIIFLTGLIGKNVRIRPKKHDSWSERPCIWGGIIADSSSMKSPALKEALAPIMELQKELVEKNKEAMKEWERKCEVAKMREAAYKKDCERILRQNPDAEVGLRPENCEPPEKPVQLRLLTSDATSEKLAEIMNGGNSLTLYRDELSALLKNMTRYANGGSDRQFYLESYSGGGYIVDRISRGSIYVDDVYLNIVGGIQPEVAKTCFSMEAGEDDGFFQRFGLLVYPNKMEEWKNIDQLPDFEAKKDYSDLCRNIFDGKWREDLKSDGDTPYVQFDKPAQAIFYDWLGGHMRKKHKLKQESKMRGLIAHLCLVFHVANTIIPSGESMKLVNCDTLLSVLNFAENYLLPMWDRIDKAFGSSEEESGARKLAAWILSKNPENFGTRDITRKGWVNMKTKSAVEDAIGVLLDCDILIEKSIQSKKGGRPRIEYLVNPLFDKTYLE